MKKAIVTVGISASGKTTWTDNFVRENEGWVNINRDDIRFELFCDGVRDWSKYKWKRSKENKVTESYNKKISLASSDNLNIICSDTNLSPKYRNALVSRLESSGYEVEFKSFPVTIEEAWKRDSLRENGVGHSVIYKQWNQWVKYLKDSAVYIPDKSKDKAVIVDIDGTLAHMTGRSPFDWEKVGTDEVDELIKSITNGFYLADYRVILLSGRDSVCRTLTEDWLDENEISYDRLFMRANNDMRKDTIIKKELFFNHVASEYNVVGVVDDRPSVCRMWMDFGLKVVNVGNPWIEF